MAFIKFNEFFLRPGCVLWILVNLLYVFDPRANLDSDETVFCISTPALFYGPRVARFKIMAAEKKCCVSTCGSTDEILHKFPNPCKDPNRFRTWIYNIGGDILALDNDYIYRYRRVCHFHFETCFHTRSKMLSANAVPTLNLPGPFKRKLLSDITNIATSKQAKTSTFDGDNKKENSSYIEMASTSGQAQKNDIQVDHILKKSIQDKSMPVQTNAEETVPAHFAAEQTIPEQSIKTQSPHSKSADVSTKKLPNTNVKTLLKNIKTLQKKNISYQQRLKNALKLSSNQTFQNTLNKFKSLAAIFTVMQFREISKPKMARRFTRQEKIMALTVYKQGPKAYRWLSKLFVLPSPVTLSRMTSRAGLCPGINENVFEQLRRKVQSMKTLEKLCTLIFDEMALDPHFDYNRKKDKIIGFVNHNGLPLRKIADHVLVFMIRGIVKNYKQAIYYSFCSSSTPKEVLAAQIKQIIKKLHEVGFTVLATVCDQGTSNTSAINMLVAETKREHLRKNETFNDAIFEIEGKVIVPLYDVPHLLKGMRNNLLTKHLKFRMEGEEKCAKWEHILHLYNNNPTYKGLKMIKNLTEYHCNKDRIPKMKVKYAAQVFSQTVGKTMGYLADNGIIPNEARDTADLIIFLDNLFDSFNGSYNNSKIRSGKDLLLNVTPKSPHKNFWVKSKNILQSMRFVNSTGSSRSVPTVNNWLHTLKGVEVLRDTLFNDFNMKSIWCRHLNQDPIENYFGGIRSHGVRNISPTCAAFEAAFASLLVSNMSSNYSPGSNCEEDLCAVFASFDELFFSSNDAETTHNSSIESKHEGICEIDLEDVVADIITDFDSKQAQPQIKAPLEYVTGYLLRKLPKDIHDCEQCVGDLYEKDVTQNQYLMKREYTTKTRLKYPSKKLKMMFSECQDIIYYILQTKSHIMNINLYTKTVLYARIDINVCKCPIHKKNVIEFMFDFMCRFFTFNWCKMANKLLSGISSDPDVNDSIQQQALQYYVKRRRNKNK